MIFHKVNNFFYIPENLKTVLNISINISMSRTLKLLEDYIKIIKLIQFLGIILILFYLYLVEIF